MFNTLIRTLRGQFQFITSRPSVSRRRRARSVSPEQLEARCLLSAVVELVQDLNTEPAGSNPNNNQMQATINGITFFTASTVTATRGNELWRTDGTPEGTLRLTEVAGSSNDSQIVSMTAGADQILFTRVDRFFVRRLYRSDGTVDGTRLVSDVRLDYADGELTKISPFGEGVIFAANSPSRAVWTSDGNPNGTKEFISLASKEYVQEIKDAGDGRIFYVTYEVQPTNPVNVVTWSLKVSDGTAAGTKSLLTLIGGFPTLRDLVVDRGVAYVSGLDDAQGIAIWKSDGTVDGTHLVTRQQPSDQVGLQYHRKMFVGDRLFFTLSGPGGESNSLWSTMGDPSSTVKLTTLNFGSRSQVVFQGKLYFVKNFQLWKSDGTSEGTIIAAAPQGATVLGILTRINSLLLVCQNSDSGQELWQSDGTTVGTALLKDIRPGVKSSMPNNQFDDSTAQGGEVDYVVFAADDGIHGNEMWRTDGTASGTRLLVDIAQGTADANPDSLVNHNGELVLLASPYLPATGQWLWQTNSGNHGADHIGYGITIQPFGGKLYYERVLADGSFSGTYLWNGTEGVPQNGTPSEIITNSPVFHLQNTDVVFGWTLAPQSFRTQLRTLENGEKVSKLLKSFLYVGTSYFVQNNILYFGARDDVGDRLWRSDGTIEGTFPLSDRSFLPYFSTDRDQFSSLGDRVLIGGISGCLITDGTVVGTHFVKDWIPGAESVALLSPLQTRGIAILLVTGGQFSGSLWKTDGTELGTAQFSVPFVSVVHDWVATKDQVYFSGRLNGKNVLFSTDFSSDRVKSIHTFESANDYISKLRAIENKIIFTVDNTPDDTRTIWVSDGTSEGTVPVHHNLEGSLVLRALPQFMLYDDGIGFIAATPEVGYELFRIDTTIPAVAPTGIAVHAYGEGVELAWPDVVGAIQYDVWVRNLSDPAAPVIKKRLNDPRLLLLDDTGYTIDRNIASSAYRIWIRSLPVLGNPSAWSEPKDFVLGRNPILYAVPQQTVETRPTFKWVGPDDVESYEVWLTNRDTKTRDFYRSGLTQTSIRIDHNLAPAKYAVWVRGKRSDGTTTDWSALTEFDVLTVVAPTLTSDAVQRSSKPTFKWQTVANATGYDLEVRMVGSSVVVYSASNIRSLTHVAEYDLLAGEYSVTVRALKGTRPLTVWSGGQTVRSLLQPQNLTATATGFVWNAVRSALSYTFELRNIVSNAVVYSKTQTGTTFDPPAPVGPGRYALRVYSAFVGGSSFWTSPLPYEVVRSATVSITSSNAATVDGTPTILWKAVTNAKTYEVVVTQVGFIKSLYVHDGIVGTSHLVAVPLQPATYQIQVRAIFADGSRTALSTIQTLVIGPAPVLSISGRKLQWTAVNGATSYEVWVNYVGTLPQRQIVYESSYVRTQLTLPTTLPKGKFKAWVRAIRAEGGETYAGLWTSALEFEL